MTLLAVYQSGLWATGISLILLEAERGIVAIVLFSAVWPLWFLAMLQESVECL